MYKAVIFDFFGVFCPDITLEWFKKTVQEYESKLADFQEICTRSDYGKLSRADFNKEVAALANVPISDLVDGVEAEIAINTQLVEYAKRLKSSGYTIACLSNGTHEWTLRVINDHGLGRLFDLVVLSGDLGIVKPNPEIYKYTLKKLGIKPSEAVFVDDREVNTLAAEVYGIPSLVFTSTEAFIVDFEALTQRNSL
jgi:epoxide hydrolase-like predicted phosphatase